MLRAHSVSWFRVMPGTPSSSSAYQPDLALGLDQVVDPLELAEADGRGDVRELVLEAVGVDPEPARALDPQIPGLVGAGVHVGVVRHEHPAFACHEQLRALKAEGAGRA